MLYAEYYNNRLAATRTPTPQFQTASKQYDKLDDLVSECRKAAQHWYLRGDNKKVNELNYLLIKLQAVKKKYEKYSESYVSYFLVSLIQIVIVHRRGGDKNNSTSSGEMLLRRLNYHSAYRIFRLIIIRDLKLNSQTLSYHDLLNFSDANFNREEIRGWPDNTVPLTKGYIYESPLKALDRRAYYFNYTRNLNVLNFDVVIRLLKDADNQKIINFLLTGTFHFEEGQVDELLIYSRSELFNAFQTSFNSFKQFFMDSVTRKSGTRRLTRKSGVTRIEADDVAALYAKIFIDFCPSGTTYEGIQNSLQQRLNNMPELYLVDAFGNDIMNWWASAHYSR